MGILDQLRLKQEDLVSNASPRLPVCICVDASYSMRFDQRMKQVNDGLRSFIDEIKQDDYAMDSVELCIISCGGSAARVEQDFQLARKTVYKDIQADGRTPLGEATMLAIERIEERVKLYETHGISSYKPWLFLLSDGAATDAFQMAAEKICYLQKEGVLKVHCVAIGEESNDLAAFHADGEVWRLKDFKLGDFFSWISKSMSQQSRQSPNMDSGGLEIDRSLLAR